MKTHITDQTLVDVLVVTQALPVDEIKQLEAFTGAEFSAEQVALQAYTAPGPKWTIRVKETGEPVAVAGMIPIRPTVWRTWFLATQRAWDEFGREVTIHVARTRKKLLEDIEFARIETVALATRKQACDWYEAVGMEYESTMRGYGAAGESAVMFVSTKGARNY